MKMEEDGHVSIARGAESATTIAISWREILPFSLPFLSNSTSLTLQIPRMAQSWKGMALSLLTMRLHVMLPERHIQFFARNLDEQGILDLGMRPPGDFVRNRDC